MNNKSLGLAGVDLIHLAEDKDKWWTVVNTAMNIRGSTKRGEFPDQLRNSKILKKDCTRW
jgi:hypothetical protein